MGWTSPRTWVDGETVFASLMNTHVRDNLKELGDAWTSYTPSWTGSGSNPSIGNGTIAGRRILAGKLCIFEIQILMGSTTSYGSGNYSLTLPAAPRVTAANDTFSGMLYDSSAGSGPTAIYPIVGISASSTTINLAALPTTAGNPYRTITPTSVVTLANGDRITLSGVFETA